MLLSATAQILVTAVARAEGRDGKVLSIDSPLEARQKIKYDPDSYDDLVLRNASGAPNTVVIVAGFGDYDAPASTLSISGVVAVAEEPSTSIANLAPIAAADTAETVLVAASVTRRRLRISADALNAGPVYIRSVSGGNAIAELQAGQFQQFDTAAALWVRNDSGAVANIFRMEES
jgi:hypothetical protein